MKLPLTTGDCGIGEADPVDPAEFGGELPVLTVLSQLLVRKRMCANPLTRGVLIGLLLTGRLELVVELLLQLLGLVAVTVLLFRLLTWFILTGAVCA
jgi:hypothetical protein